MVMGLTSIILKKDNLNKDRIITVCTAIVVCVFAYLLVYFFIFEGCEELIMFWVLGNLAVIIAFVIAKMGYILFKQGKEGLRRAISLRNINHDTSKQSIEG